MPWFVPLLIFLARVCDVSVGTVRTMLMISGHRVLAAALGTVEVAIWIFAVGGTIEYLQHPLAVIAFAGGFGTGVLVGMVLEARLALGYRLLRVISTNPELDLAAEMRSAGYRVTRVEGSGMRGPVEIAFLVIPRSRLPQVKELVRKHAPDAFLSVERVETPISANPGDSLDSRFSRSFLERIHVRK